MHVSLTVVLLNSNSRATSLFDKPRADQQCDFVFTTAQVFSPHLSRAPRRQQTATFMPLNCRWCARIDLYQFGLGPARSPTVPRLTYYRTNRAARRRYSDPRRTFPLIRFRGASPRCPLYPRKRTFAHAITESLDFPTGSVSAKFRMTPIFGRRLRCCAHELSGHAVETAIPVTNSRRRIWLTQASRPGIVAGQTGILEVVWLEFFECPLWVKSGRDAPKFRCPLYPRKRTFAHAIRMSALGQKQT